MTTQEIINNEKVSIEWEFIDIQERHGSNWCEWTVSGVDNNGNLYMGSCQADGSNPENLHDDVTDIEEVLITNKHQS